MLLSVFISVNNWEMPMLRIYLEFLVVFRVEDLIISYPLCLKDLKVNYVHTCPDSTLLEESVWICSIFTDFRSWIQVLSWSWPQWTTIAWKETWITKAATFHCVPWSSGIQAFRSLFVHLTQIRKLVIWEHLEKMPASTQLNNLLTPNSQASSVCTSCMLI